MPRCRVEWTAAFRVVDLQSSVAILIGVATTSKTAYRFNSAAGYDHSAISKDDTAKRMYY